MPTLRVELLKSREEDDNQAMMVEERVEVHSNRGTMYAGQPQHATKLKYSITEPLKQRKDYGSACKTPPGTAKKHGENEIMHASFSSQSSQSPSESDSFSIKSSSSSSKSEADSIKKPSPPVSVVKPHSTSLSLSLGSYLGTQAVEMWDVTHMSPFGFSKAIHEKLSAEKALQDHSLVYSISQGKMVDSHLQRRADVARCVDPTHLRDGCGLTHASPKVAEEVRSDEDGPSEAEKVLFKAEIISNSTHFEKRSTCPRAFSCHVSSLQSKHDGEFSFEPLPLSKGTHKQDIMSSCGNASVDGSMYPEVVTDYSKGGSARVSLEKYIFSTPMMGRSVSSAQSRSERDIGHGHDGMRKATRGCVTPPPLHEIGCKSNSEEFTPVSPLSLSEAWDYQRFNERNGKDYVDMAWLTTLRSQAPSLHSPSKAQWDWRSRSLGARASLKSAVRNLEAAFSSGARSVSLPKTRSQRQQREKIRPESSKLIDRVFASPAKARRHKHTETLEKPIQRPSHSGDQDSMISRRELHTHACSGEWAGTSHPMFPPLPPSKHEISDLKVSSVAACPPTITSVHDRLAPLKRLSWHTAPVVSTPPASMTSPRNATACMQQGYLQCIERDGVACYTLSLKDSEEMLLAKASSLYGHDSGKWMYTFHSGKSKIRGKGANGWRSWLKKDTKCTSDLVGKMQVSSRVCADVGLTGKRTQSLVSEYVLHDERNDDAARSQSLRFLSSSNPCHSTHTPAQSPSSLRSAYDLIHRKQVPDIPRSPSSARMSVKAVNNNNLVLPHSPLKGTPVHQLRYSMDTWSDSDVTERDIQHLRPYPSLHSELAAIVIKMPTDDTEEDNDQPITGTCRRSLKFGVDDDSKGYQGDPQKKVVQGAQSDSMMACGRRYGLSENTTTSEIVTMMLPKELHGMPKGGVDGPTSLIERWKCGGKCDCGGWDMGCGMKIFSTQQCDKLDLTTKNSNSIISISHNQPLIIYSQGKTHDMLLNLSLVQEGYFILKFRNELSALKAFAVSVAILHSRGSSLTTGKLKHTENTMN